MIMCSFASQISFSHQDLEAYEKLQKSLSRRYEAERERDNVYEKHGDSSKRRRVDDVTIAKLADQSEGVAGSIAPSIIKKLDEKRQAEAEVAAELLAEAERSAAAIEQKNKEKVDKAKADKDAGRNVPLLRMQVSSATDKIATILKSKITGWQSNLAALKREGEAICAELTESVFCYIGKADLHLLPTTSQRSCSSVLFLYQHFPDFPYIGVASQWPCVNGLIWFCEIALLSLSLNSS